LREQLWILTKFPFNAILKFKMRNHNSAANVAEIMSFNPNKPNLFVFFLGKLDNQPNKSNQKMQQDNSANEVHKGI
jgi:hypothetical protein